MVATTIARHACRAPAHADREPKAVSLGADGGLGNTRRRQRPHHHSGNPDSVHGTFARNSVTGPGANAGTAGHKSAPLPSEAPRPLLPCTRSLGPFRIVGWLRPNGSRLSSGALKKK